MRVWIGFLAFALMFGIPNVSALNFTDNQGYGFDSGTHINTTADPVLGLTLANEITEAYFTNGSFMSRTFDAGQIALWSSATLNISNLSEHLYSVLYAATNNSAAWGSFANLPLIGMFLNYTINLSTANNQTRPAIDMVNITYSYIAPNVLPVSPADGNSTNINSVLLNCSATSVNGLKNISIYWNENNWLANFTADATGFYNYTTLAISGFPQGAYKWACLAYDNQSNTAWSANRTIYYASDAQAPAISHNISAPIVSVGSPVSLSVYAADSNLASIWANISYPNASTIRLGVSNGGYANFTPPVTGDYSATFFANDTLGNTANATASFKAVGASQINISITGKNYTSLSSNVTFYFAGTSAQAASFSSGSYGVKTLPNTSYDMRVQAYDGGFDVKLLGVDIASNANREMTIDKPAVSGFIVVFAINSSYSISGARIRISYSGISVSREGSLKMQKCSDWNFTNSVCVGGWIGITFTSDAALDCLQADVTGFSAYGIMQGGFCGDGICSADEGTINCSADCVCINGVSRGCSIAHNGSCAIGTETCINGAWSGCPLPSAEICNQLDDDCDGIVDNVGGGDSVASARCQCYNRGLPVNEECNDVDDDCNGQVDENLYKQCGTDTGACSFGTAPCINGLWSEGCSGGVSAIPEICGNNVDDDCDGMTDEGCASSVACQWGLIPETGCKCGNTTYASGHCCFGDFQTEPCGRIPWELLITFGVMGLVVAAVVHITRKKSRDISWGELEKKYTPTTQTQAC